MSSVDFKVTIASDEYSVSCALQPEESSPQHLKTMGCDLEQFLYQHLSVNLTASDEHGMFNIMNFKKSNLFATCCRIKK